MAEVVKGVDLREFRKGRRYPWQQWMDGRVWKLCQGEDFSCGLDTFRNAFYTRCTKMGKRGITKTVDDSTIMIQAVDL